MAAFTSPVAAGLLGLLARWLFAEEKMGMAFARHQVDQAQAIRSKAKAPLSLRVEGVEADYGCSKLQHYSEWKAVRLRGSTAKNGWLKLKEEQGRRKTLWRPSSS